eukprot:m.238299 g.238299  ORF g.238299 m.238299 type:complete len:173 (-) comp15805_c0_seq13:589-1107(-)
MSEAPVVTMVKWETPSMMWVATKFSYTALAPKSTGSTSSALSESCASHPRNSARCVSDVRMRSAAVLHRIVGMYLDPPKGQQGLLDQWVVIHGGLRHKGSLRNPVEEPGQSPGLIAERSVVLPAVGGDGCEGDVKVLFLYRLQPVHNRNDAGRETLPAMTVAQRPHPSATPS